MWGGRYPGQWLPPALQLRRGRSTAWLGLIYGCLVGVPERRIGAPGGLLARGSHTTCHVGAHQPAPRSNHTSGASANDQPPAWPQCPLRQCQLANPRSPSVCGTATTTFCGERSQSAAGILDSGTVSLDGEATPESIFLRAMRASNLTCRPIVPDDPKLPMTFVNCLSEGTADCASGTRNIPRACAPLSRTQSFESLSAWISTGIHNSGSARISPSAHKAFARTLGSGIGR